MEEQPEKEKMGISIALKIQIKNCLKEFSCEVCKLLNKYKNYYFPNAANNH